MHFFSKSVALHFYDDENLDRLNVLLRNQNSWEALEHIEKESGLSDDVWLVHVPFSTQSGLANMFKRSHLRLDSHVYAFFHMESRG